MLGGRWLWMAVLVLSLLAHGRASIFDEFDSGTEDVVPFHDREDLDQDMKDFLEWLTAKGMNFQSQVDVAITNGTGRGLLARRSFMPGETMLAVPPELLITPDMARRSEVGRAFREHGLDDCSGGEDSTYECMPLLAMHLTVLYYNESHDFHPWMKILPRKLTTPLFWSDKEREELQGSNLYNMLDGWTMNVEKLHRSTARVLGQHNVFPDLPKAIYSLKEFKWAYATIFARAFDVDGKSFGFSGRQRIMAPMADLFNHGDVKTSYTFNAASGHFELFTQQFFSRGEQIFMNYDSKNNAEFLLQYGFVIESNPHDYVGIAASIGNDQPFYRDKSLDCLRVLCATKEEMESGESRKILRGKQISDSNEICVYTTLNIIKNDLPHNVKTALILRRDEKRLLILNLSRYQRLLARLKERTKVHRVSDKSRSKRKDEDDEDDEDDEL
ncbi:hypothetical protein GUITHDRAFT_109909 [Guillardia theta CCMP2712]|uniref:SET domain-containing protein n=1 Tax=Guillardia theta (strain CCMP2712) TaxID=905079 RepID=L1J7R6_GUITC|nr:hypothetical protein GUITHDRAFT_109909 [Guillardia theta CCMP2712]EKX44125.1 hypothetical protein GUITHDRAFT_109909 [Guillardia theta CCMP2712]|eukprot:XP_005831105.1 hypothetical protein GUITHDRAFT_109909 [Guillardia theta CCMP2712]